VVEGVEAYGKIDAARCEHVVHAEIHLNDENKAELKFEVLEVKALQNMKERTKIAASKNGTYHGRLRMPHTLDETRVFLGRSQCLVLALCA
jgi:hypothetical protein